MGKSFAQAMLENDAQQYGMSKHEARRAVARYMQEQEDAKVKQQQEREIEMNAHVGMVTTWRHQECFVVEINGQGHVLIQIAGTPHSEWVRANELGE